MLTPIGSRAKHHKSLFPPVLSLYALEDRIQGLDKRREELPLLLRDFF